MSEPYRDAPVRAPVQAPRDRGIVGDVISQFADPYAFYRELVQNAIDAGSPEVEIELSYDEGARRMRVSVRDRGEGMTRSIIEDQLLVLFRSTKENDRTKIGKFGIGFSSVLAPDPEVVAITTVRDGKRLMVHLYRDLGYELFDGGRATQPGTTIDLEIAMDRDRVHAFEAHTKRALSQWCRHATVPIHVTFSHPEGRSTERIDRPLAIEDALVEVRRVVDGGQLVVVAGLTKQATPYVGFFNHGLTLAETTNDIAGNVSVKVQDARLGHTLSRDDVRRDAHYDRALACVREVVREDLRAKLATRLRELAEAGAGADYLELLDAVVRAKIFPASWYFPLLEARAGTVAVAATELGRTVWCSARVTPVTAALVSASQIVLRATEGDTVARAVAHACGARVRDAASELTAVTPVEPTDGDVALLRLFEEVLAEVHRAPSAIVLAKLAGFHQDLLSVALPKGNPRVIDREDAAKNPFTLLGRRALALSVAHPHVAAARRHQDPVLAATHLARIVLLQYGALDRRRSHALLEHALAGLGVAR